MLKLYALLSATLLLGCAPAAAGESLPSVRDGPDGAIEMVTCGRRTGTAFRIEPDRLVTAAHVTAGGDCTIAGVPVATVRKDGALDVAELRAADRRTFIPVRCSVTREGRLYRAIGFAGGAQRMNLPWQATGQADAPGKAEFFGESYPGMSGGPVLDREGRAIGIVLQRYPARARLLASTWLCGGRR